VAAAKPFIVALSAAAVIAGCGGKPAPIARGPEAAVQDAGYLAPPAVDGVRFGAGSIVLSGAAPAGAKVRLASPAGQAMVAAADAQGRWTIALPTAPEARIFGLSMTLGARQAQAEGYLLLTPAGDAALLRAGSSALRIKPPARSGLRSLDFDRGGGLEVSAAAPPGATVIVELDGRQVSEGRADASGRYDASLGSPTPVRAGAHVVHVFGDGFSDQVAAQVTPAAPLASGPLRSQLTPAGLRVDWMTPGGGVQSTLLVH
jgi:Fe2+ transport system protein FeoA